MVCASDDNSLSLDQDTKSNARDTHFFTKKYLQIVEIVSCYW